MAGERRPRAVAAVLAERRRIRVAAATGGLPAPLPTPLHTAPAPLSASVRTAPAPAAAATAAAATAAAAASTAAVAAAASPPPAPSNQHVVNDRLVAVTFPDAGIQLFIERSALAPGSHGTVHYHVSTNGGGSAVLSVDARGVNMGAPGGRPAAFGGYRPPFGDAPPPPPLESLPSEEGGGGVPDEVLDAVPVRTFGASRPTVAAAAAAAAEEAEAAAAVLDVTSSAVPLVDEAVADEDKPAGVCYEDTPGATQCVICFDAFQDGDHLLVLPCNHEFHTACAGPWFDGHQTCPSCRGPVAKAPAAGEAAAELPPLSPLTPPASPPAAAAPAAGGAPAI